MPELISIEEAARITGFPYEEIERLGKIPKDNLFPYENRYTYGRS